MIQLHGHEEQVDKTGDNNMNQTDETQFTDRPVR